MKNQISKPFSPDVTATFDQLCRRYRQRTVLSLPNEPGPKSPTNRKCREGEPEPPSPEPRWRGLGESELGAVTEIEQIGSPRVPGPANNKADHDSEPNRD
ncbi:hypothetical protein LOK49_Contig3G00014 [Camellia lanceoleosa]|nr:hypothetical protein LOK49_Contig3G00014 [Camellia lanceoleosa]